MAESRKIILLRSIEAPNFLFPREPYVMGSTITGSSSGEVPFEYLSPGSKLSRRSSVSFEAEDAPVIAKVSRPEEFIQIDLRVLDSDEGARSVAQKIGRVREILKGSAIGRLVAAGSPSTAAALRTLGPSIDVVEEMLRENGDDLLDRFSLSVSADFVGEIALSGKKVNVKIELMDVELVSGRLVGPPEVLEGHDFPKCGECGSSARHRTDEGSDLCCQCFEALAAEAVSAEVSGFEVPRDLAEKLQGLLQRATAGAAAAGDAEKMIQDLNEALSMVADLDFEVSETTTETIVIEVADADDAALESALSAAYDGEVDP